MVNAMCRSLPSAVNRCQQREGAPEPCPSERFRDPSVPSDLRG
ncbi:hypothetical protein H9633_06075 [Microbacterium sp. Re1]|uniref:Uncharacterized protein n=1 Tax=Microbacterium commune TaxID=2762219 RepID=A0ABR8W4A9_9MICO|nr:hypothetical protein [Microbacterium commune]